MAILAVVMVQGSSVLGHAACSQVGENEVTKSGQANYIVRIDKDGETKNAEIREFIWCHWHEKQPGSLSVGWISPGGQVSRNSFVFVSDEDGLWSLQVGIDREPRAKTRGDHVEYQAYILERIQIPHGPQTDTALIANEAIMTGDRYRLVLRNKAGKKLAKI